MALDTVILDHVEEMDVMEDKISNDIDKIINSIDIDAVMDNPQEALEVIGNTIMEMVDDEYYPKVAELGFDFAGEVIKDGEIVVNPTNNPQLNKDEVDTDGEV